MNKFSRISAGVLLAIFNILLFDIKSKAQE